MPNPDPALLIKTALLEVWCGDCLDVLPLLTPRPAPKGRWPTYNFDLLLTDPPYGIGVAPTGRVGQKNGQQFRPVTWDSAPPTEAALDILRAQARHAVIWGGHVMPGLPPNYGWLTWDKKHPPGLDFAPVEHAWTSLPRAPRLFRYLWNGPHTELPEKRIHPTQKPVALLAWCLERVQEVAPVRRVLDPYAGSGSTLIACAKAGIQCVGIERDPANAADLVARLKTEGWA